MQAVLRLLLWLAISASIATAVIPARADAPQPAKSSCCAKMKMEAPANDCAHHAPKSDQDKQCCSLCWACVALFLAQTTPSVYPPSGGDYFATLKTRAHLRAQRPPVPPPRA
jgi:hypothetical protein